MCIKSESTHLDLGVNMSIGATLLFRFPKDYGMNVPEFLPMEYIVPIPYLQVVDSFSNFPKAKGM